MFEESYLLYIYVLTGSKLDFKLNITNSTCPISCIVLFLSISAAKRELVGPPVFFFN